LGLVLVAPSGYVLQLDFSGRLNEQLGYTTGISYTAPFILYRQIVGPLIYPVILMLAGYALAERKESAYVLFSWATIPVAIAFLVSCLYPNRLVLTQRYLLMVLPAILVLAARGLHRLSISNSVAVAIICVYCLVMGALSFARILRYKTTDWRTIASTLGV
jgi:hypothetical protein